MNQLRQTIPLVALAATLLTIPSAAGAESALKVGDQFPELGGFALEGDVPKDLKGKIVLIDFWASWCGPCKGTFPIMESLHRRFGKRSLIVVAVNEDKSEAAMKEFLKQHTVSFIVVRDARKKLAAAVRVPSLPTSYILDRDGKVVSIQSGVGMVQESKDFIRQIEELVNKSSSPP